MLAEAPKNSRDNGRLTGDLLKVSPLQSANLSPATFEVFSALDRQLRNGRHGKTWCRWAVRSLEKGSFLVADATALGGLSRLEVIVALTADAFESTCPPPSVKSRGLPPSSLTVLLRDDIPHGSAEELLHSARPHLLERGQMMALLHPDSQLTPLTAGPPGRPYHAPHIFLTTRWAVPDDRIFVDINPTLLERLERWLARTQEVDQRE